MDYDCGVTGLSSPPASAVMTQYRPAISIRNNGIHNAIASGYLRIYSAGLLVFESEVYSGTLAPGATGTADALEYWTPTIEGKYIVQGYVSTPLDQVEPNNNLAPVTIDVTGAEPPVPPTVPLHAAQHEEGGTDPLNVEGLHGVLADRQLAQAHAAQHQAGGTDALNVGSLQGILAQDQPAQIHDNTRHNPDMCTASELTAHQDSHAVHTSADNLANRDISGPHAGLVTDTQLAPTTEVADPGDDPDKAGLRVGRDWGPVNAVHHAAKHEVGGLDEIKVPSILSGISRNVVTLPASGQITIVTTELTAAMAKEGTIALLESMGTVTTVGGVGQGVTFTLYHQNGGVSTPLAAAAFTVAANKSFIYHITAIAGIGASAALAGLIHGELTEVTTAAEQHRENAYAGAAVAPASTSRFFLAVIWVAGSLGSTMTSLDALALGVVRR